LPRVVPSQVVSFIDRVTLQSIPNGTLIFNTIKPAFLSTVLDLLNQVPDQLLTMNNDAYAALIQGRATINEMLVVWTSNRNAGQNLQIFAYQPTENPLARIRDALAQCPDEFPAPGASELNFITDVDLRTELRTDIGRINAAMANGEWKAATVLAGSAIEALLLWALTRRTPTEIANAIAALRANRELFTNPDPNQLEAREWDLHGYIQVSEELGIIKPNTAISARLAKDFRNLIHPGRALRLAQKCDRATALSAVAGMEHVVRDLTP
jgi:hypothetical protein